MYLRCYEESLGVSWLRAYEKKWTPSWLPVTSTWIARMALIHPSHYEKPLQGAKCSVRGNRTFGKSRGDRRGQCCAEALWGYSCALTVGELAELHYDHVYPWSFGGPDLPSNIQLLCKMHNELKGSDLHVFPWERGEPSWVSLMLAKIQSDRTNTLQC